MKRDISNRKYQPCPTPEANTPVGYTSAEIKVLVQDYHDLYREAFIAVLRINGINVISEIQDGIDILQAITPANQPEIAIINYKTSKRESLNAACSIKERYPHIKVIINSQFNYGLPIDRIIQIGIEGIIIKAIHSTAHVISTIRLVYSGGCSYTINTPVL